MSTENTSDAWWANDSVQDAGSSNPRENRLSESIDLSRKPSAVDAFRFAMSDLNLWHNVIVGAVFTLIPIVGSIVMVGWCVAIRRRLATAHPNPIPRLEFSDFGYYLGLGAIPFLVYAALPVVASVLSNAISIVLTNTLTLVRTSTYPPIAHGAHVPSSFPITVVVVSSSLLLLIMVGLWIASVLVVTPFQIRYELTGKFRESFSWQSISSVAKPIWRTLLITSITITFCVFGVTLCGAVVCLVGVLGAAVISDVARSHLRDQLYRHYLSLGGVPFAVAPCVIPSERNVRY